MLRLGKLSNKFQKRTLRVLYGQTQTYPYSATLDSTFRDATDGSITLLGTTAASAANPIRTADAFTLKGGLVPGTVVSRVPGTDRVKVAAGEQLTNNVGEEPFGLLANFVGGQLDECGDEDAVGVWRSGQGGVFQILAPAYGTVTVAGASKAGQKTPLYAGADGRLTTTAPATGATVVANLLKVVGSSYIEIDLKV